MAFLSGDDKTVVEALKSEMKSASDAFLYERAASLRDKIRDIESLMQRQQAVQADGREQDVISLIQDDLDAMVQVIQIGTER